MSAFAIALFLLSRGKTIHDLPFIKVRRQKSAIKLKSIIVYKVICSELFNNMKGGSLQ